jgi:putative hydrolase of the HAD superfamily
VLFDFGGTLDADGVPWKERFLRLCLDEGIAVSRERFDPIFYAADDALVGAVPASLSFSETVGRLSAAVTCALGAPAAGPRVAARFLDDARAQLEANRPLLRRLAARYHLGIVSNFYGNLATVCDNLSIRPLFGVIVDSTLVGFSKPDGRIFQRAVDELGLAPAAVIFVGDSLARDMAGARALGMRHIWLAGEGEDTSRRCCPGDRAVRTLREVEELLL